ncbi:enoyl-CoA hydratase-related protein [Hymenobacter terricola]|uniref:enoyl-CoA hydratase-related protein n=1 Tax=Hymenobacter terricola TaxID=2819236 RepID=UPI001B314BE4|nr:enoyl-CoA hydratase-related protein [Hymenobacter terricola]
MEFLLVTPQSRPGVALIQLNRPKELNALNGQLVGEIRDALQALDADEAVRVVILTGNERAFAAGADIKEMAGKTAVDMFLDDRAGTLEQIRRFRKPLIGAVSGFVLGGGCELAMTCDMLIASETAQFGQPEIRLGIIPGGGGTQRLTRAVGKARAMEMVLTGEFISAREAHRVGLVTRVVPVGQYLEEAYRLAARIAAMSPVAARLAKEAVNRAFETPLEEGLQFERKNFYLAFASEDQKEGMAAFVEKRKPAFKGR